MVWPNICDDISLLASAAIYTSLEDEPTDMLYFRCATDSMAL
jgi:hypothetical protein